MIKALKLLFIFLIILFSGCEKEEHHEMNIKTDTTKKIRLKVSTVLPKIHKGMYSRLSGENILTDCDSKNIFFLASELEEVKKLFEDNIGANKNIYIEAEGYVSAKANSGNVNMDSLFVITNLIKSVPLVNCNN